MLKTLTRRLPIYLLLAALCGAFLAFALEIPSFSIRNHIFRPSAIPVILWFLICFLALVSISIGFARVAGRLYGFPADGILNIGLLTWLPLLFLSLMPFALRHYLTAADLLARARLFVLAVAAAVIYLDAVLVLRLRRWKGKTESRIAGRLASLPIKKKLAVLFIVSLVLFNAGSLVMISRGISFGGDEPHYLLISHSLLHDGDFDLAGNYARRDYEKYMRPGVPLDTHVVPGAKPGSRLSFHSPGVSILLVPFYAVGSLFGGRTLLFFIRFGMSLFAALLGLQVFLFALREWKKNNLALILWSLFLFTSPVYFYAIHVYPEIVVALMSFTAFRLLNHSAEISRSRWLALGLLLSLLIWFHAIKYLLILATLGLYALWILAKRSRTRGRWACFLAPAALVTLAYFVFQYVLYGSMNPSAVSWQGKMTGQESLGFLKTLFVSIPLRSRLETLAGYFFCQKDGFLFYAPLYFFSFLGAVEMWRKKKKDLWLLLFAVMPYILNQAFLTQRTGYAPQARPLVAVFWGMGILLGSYLAAEKKRFFAPLFRGAVMVSFCFAGLLLARPLNLYQETTVGSTERGGGLFYLLSNLHFQITNWLPSFIKVDEWRWWPNFIWPALLVVFIIAYALSRKRARVYLYSTHVIIASAALAVFFAWFVLFPRLVLMNPVKAVFPSGERVTFYSLSRVARMSTTGRFLLPEDNRPYHFLFTSAREVRRLRLEFGPEQGSYDTVLTAFDQGVYKGQGEKEIKSLELVPPPRYKLKGVNLYWLTITLGRGEGVNTSQSPYVFNILPAR